MYDLRNWNLDGADEKDHLLVANLRMVRHSAGVERYWLENGEANFANSATTEISTIDEIRQKRQALGLVHVGCGKTDSTRFTP